MVYQALFVLLAVVGITCIVYAVYRLCMEYHLGGAEAHAPVPAVRYRGT